MSKFHLVLLLFVAFNLNAQEKAKLISKKDFAKPAIDKYSIIINPSNDTAYCYYSIFLRSYDEKISGIYIEISKNKITFECYLSHGQLNGLFRKYNNSGQLLKYGKYINNILIENNEIVYDENLTLLKINQTFPNQQLIPK